MFHVVFFFFVFQAVFEPHALRSAYWKFLLRVTEGKWVTLRFLKYQIWSLARIITRTTFSIKFRTRADTRVPWNDTHDNHWRVLTYWCHVLTCRWTLCKKMNNYLNVLFDNSDAFTTWSSAICHRFAGMNISLFDHYRRFADVTVCHRFAGMNRRLLDGFGTKSSQLYPNYWPQYDTRFTQLSPNTDLSSLYRWHRTHPSRSQAG